MTLIQKTIAYSAIVVGIFAVLSAFGTSVHIAYHIFTSSANNKVKGKGKKTLIFPYVKFCPDVLIISSSQVVDVTHWNTDYVRILAIGGGGGLVMI